MRISDWSSDVCSSDLADGFLVAGLRARGVDLHVETALEAFDRQLQMDLALAAQQHLVGVAVVLQHQRGILLAELGDAGGELHLVLAVVRPDCQARSEEHTSELQSLMRISYAVFCLKQKNK